MDIRGLNFYNHGRKPLACGWRVVKHDGMPKHLRSYSGESIDEFSADVYKTYVSGSKAVYATYQEYFGVDLAELFG